MKTSITVRVTCLVAALLVSFGIVQTIASYALPEATAAAEIALAPQTP